MDTARREVGVRDAAWSEIERACRGNIRFTFPGSRPGPERAEVFARTAVLEEYAKWLAGEAAAVHRDGSVTVNSEVVATLAALPPDSFEQSWPQMTQPALAMFLRCGACLDDQSEDDSDIAGWLADLHACVRPQPVFSVRMSRSGRHDRQHDRQPVCRQCDRSGSAAVGSAGGGRWFLGPLRHRVPERRSTAPFHRRCHGSGYRPRRRRGLARCPFRAAPSSGRGRG